MDGAHDRSRGRPEGNIMTPDEIKFEADVTAERETDEPALVVDVEGFEGPLDLLLALARQQKVDLARISILALADQYLTFIEAARKLRLELAADYLVMAAWLAYLKSRLLLPDANAPAGQSAEDMAIALAMRLKRLEAIRAAAERLFGRAQLDPSPISNVRNGLRHSTICSRRTRNNGRRRFSGMCAWSSALSGPWPRRARRLSG
jgi:hypothetical protein